MRGRGAELDIHLATQEGEKLPDTSVEEDLSNEVSGQSQGKVQKWEAEVDIHFGNPICQGVERYLAHRKT